MAERLRIGGFYPIAPGERLPTGYKRTEVRIRATGEKRQPRKGEWFLSGAIIEGYRAACDMSTEFHIGVLVSGETTWRQAEVSDMARDARKAGGQ